jgi:hypothetical protein
MKKPIENLEQLKQFTAKEKFYVVTDDEVNNMRKFTEESPITRCFDYKTSPLIKIDSKRNINYYSSRRDKIDAITNRKKSDKFIMVWSGQWSSDTFEVSEDDIKTVLLSEVK